MTHIAGIDIVRVDEHDFYVLEDNAAHAVRRLLHAGKPRDDDAAVARIFSPNIASRRSKIIPTSCWPRCAPSRRTLRPAEPTIVLLTPGQYNSAYYEHSFLADKLGVELVEGRDLVVKDDVVYMRTTEGLKRVDVIYRRDRRRLPRSAGLPPEFGARRRRACSAPITPAM